MNLIEWPYYRAEFLKEQGFSETFVSRFWSKVKITDGCWLWTASKTTCFGYGQISMGLHPRPITAHVASWLLHYGSTGGKYVLHKCDNPPCVRPDHLFLGTQLDNIQDMANKDRGRQSADAESVKTARAMMDLGMTSREIARHFGVCKSTVLNWHHHRTRNHVQT